MPSELPLPLHSHQHVNLVNQWLWWRTFKFNFWSNSLEMSEMTRRIGLQCANLCCSIKWTRTPERPNEDRPQATVRLVWTACGCRCLYKRCQIVFLMNYKTINYMLMKKILKTHTTHGQFNLLYKLHKLTWSTLPLNSNLKYYPWSRLGFRLLVLSLQFCPSLSLLFLGSKAGNLLCPMSHFKQWSDVIISHIRFRKVLEECST